MAEKKYKIVFFGTPDFASVILKQLIAAKFKPIMVITAVDKPQGRKQVLTPPPIKTLTQQSQIPVLQLKSLKDPEVVTKIVSQSPDLFIVAAYGLILPKEILEIPKYGCLNTHPSLLPKYRGASPVPATILSADKQTGVSIMLMDEKIDHGPILAQKKIKINQETTPELKKKLANIGGKLLLKTLPLWFKGKIKPQKQNHQKASFTRQIKKEHGKIDWDKSAQEIQQMWRAYQSWPGIYTFFKEKKLKILKLIVLKIKHNHNPGEVFLDEKKELTIACQKNALILKKILLEGKKPMSGKSFLNGHQDILGKILR